MTINQHVVHVHQDADAPPGVVEGAWAVCGWCTQVLVVHVWGWGSWAETLHEVHSKKLFALAVVQCLAATSDPYIGQRG